MKNTLAGLVVVVAAAQLFAREPAPSRFTFKIPEGWVDKTPADAHGKVRLAFDEKNQLAFQAKVSPGSELVTSAFLDQYIIESQRAVKRITGRELKVLKKDGFAITGGIMAARFVFETPPPADAPDAPAARQLQYYVPAGDQHAVMTFSAPSKTFERYIELFDKTAAATTVKK